jgi:hypothetical protein
LLHYRRGARLVSGGEPLQAALRVTSGDVEISFIGADGRGTLRGLAARWCRPVGREARHAKSQAFPRAARCSPP